MGYLERKIIIIINFWFIRARRWQSAIIADLKPDVVKRWGEIGGIYKIILLAFFGKFAFSIRNSLAWWQIGSAIPI
jgi:hypothetical protein